MLSLVVAALLPAAPPATGRTPVASVNGWDISDARGQCVADAQYGGGYVLALRFDYGQDVATLVVGSPAWRSVVDAAEYPVTARFSNRASYSATARGIRLPNPSGLTTGIRMSFRAEGFLADIASSTEVELKWGAIRLGAFTLRGTRQMIARLSSCAIDSYRRYPRDPFAVAPRGSVEAPSASSTPTQAIRARSNLANFVSADDYPAEALHRREQGVTEFRLTVGPDGLVRDCAITGSSGSATLDAATCRIYRSRGRFTPARDATGQPATDTVESRLRWTLPNQ